MPGTLYLVGTPIGNLSDFSPRAVEVLSGVSFVAAEDTRVAVKLLNHFSIKKPLVSYYEHNLRERGAEILARLRAGESCALVSDAGMPAISDPGEDLVRQCREGGVGVYAVPGPTAVTTAVALSGLPSGRFTFEGFLSTAKKSRAEHLREIVGERRTMVFYEAPHKLRATLHDLCETLGGSRRIAVCREITKLYEQTLFTTLLEAAAHFDEQPPKGEFVLVIEGAPAPAEAPPDEDALVGQVRELTAGGVSRSEAVKTVAKRAGVPKNQLYALCLQRDAIEKEDRP
ncbi:16S rRNA (cytidine(1402)-2'-O)-methyltransferase [Feifania hominis]|uniref:Ribosomal RNA small subunit methyltransferase I n=1 Tax=Feifania hominis TaxID=2763660 RepID=A0A926HRA2_9FIRM|nr:16S rRNA (cytidine(1402)-2'-O)-methyltransferase [Feifania hominis]MBC8537197.1 16S rRNA (cytidine(1402)-2'-O)-methyltransferase [Feifania hominis]